VCPAVSHYRYWWFTSYDRSLTGCVCCQRIFALNADRQGSPGHVWFQAPRGRHFVCIREHDCCTSVIHNNLTSKAWGRKVIYVSVNPFSSFTVIQLWYQKKTTNLYSQICKEFNFNLIKDCLGFRRNLQERNSHVIITRPCFKTPNSLDNFKGCEGKEGRNCKFLV